MKLEDFLKSIVTGFKERLGNKIIVTYFFTFCIANWRKFYELFYRNSSVFLANDSAKLESFYFNWGHLATDQSIINTRIFFILEEDYSVRIILIFIINTMKFFAVNNPIAWTFFYILFMPILLVIVDAFQANPNLSRLKIKYQLKGLLHTSRLEEAENETEIQQEKNKAKTEELIARETDLMSRDLELRKKEQLIVDPNAEPSPESKPLSEPEPSLDIELQEKKDDARASKLNKREESVLAREIDIKRREDKVAENIFNQNIKNNPLIGSEKMHNDYVEKITEPLKIPIDDKLKLYVLQGLRNREPLSLAIIQQLNRSNYTSIDFDDGHGQLIFTSVINLLKSKKIKFYKEELNEDDVYISEFQKKYFQELLIITKEGQEEMNLLLKKYLFKREI